MTMKLSLLSTIVVLGLFTTASIAHGEELFAVTPSGNSEVFFGEPPEAVAQKIANACMNRGWAVSNVSSSELTCEARLNEQQSIMGQLLLGNAHSTAPRRFLRFSIAEQDHRSRVQGSGWLELQLVGGQVNRSDISNQAQFRNSLMFFLTAAGGKVPPGTRYPNHADLGVNGHKVVIDRQAALFVDQLSSGGAAERAGIQAKDIIFRVAGKRVWDERSLLSGTEKAAEKPSFEVELFRGEAKKKVELAREFRAPATETVEPFQISKMGVETASLSTPPSLADELTKLAKLRADGFITEEEFKALKADLLK